MLKRSILFLALALWLATPVTRAFAQHSEHAASETAKENVHAVEGSAPAHDEVEHGAGGHEKAPPLLPDPTSRETVLSALWVVIIFVVLLIVLYPTAWKNVLAGLKKREERIRKDIADAEAARTKAEATLREYNAQLLAAENRVRDMIAKAATDAERIAAGIRAHAQQESEEIKERANRDIETAKNQALSEIYEQTAILATSVAEKILRRNLNADDQRDLVKSSLEQLQTIGK